MTLETRFSLSPRLAASLVPSQATVLVETDARDGAGSGPVVDAAARLAAAAGAELVLYDRSTESLFLDPYPSGPWTADVDGPHGDRPLVATEVAGLGHARLVRQVRRAEAVGAHARAWLGRGMGPGAMAEAARLSGARLVVRGRPRGNPSFLHRMAGWTPAAYRRAITCPVVEVDDAGGIVLESLSCDLPMAARGGRRIGAGTPAQP